MKCPHCGYPQAKYKHGKSKKKARTDFNARCRKCGWEGELRPSFGVVETVVTKKEVKKKKGYYIHCKLQNQKLVREAQCQKFEPISASEKKRCWNCKHHEEI